MADEKRVISLGLMIPSELEKDTIYINFRYDDEVKNVAYGAFSNEEFVYHRYCPAKDDDPIEFKDTEVSSDSVEPCRKQ